MLFGDSETLEGRTRGTKDELQVPCPSSLALKSGETKQIHAWRHRQLILQLISNEMKIEASRLDKDYAKK